MHTKKFVRPIIKLKCKKMTSFLIEGCDCVGKTTLVKQFLKHDENKRKKLKVIKCSAPPSNLCREEQRLFCKNQYEKIVRLMNSRGNLVLDRFHLGEAVYAPIFRGYYPDYVRELEKKMEDVKLIVLTANPALVVKRFDGKFITKRQIPAILKNFEAQFYLSDIKNKVLIDISSLSPEEVYLKAIFRKGVV